MRLSFCSDGDEDIMTERPLNLAPQRGPSVWDRAEPRRWSLEESEKWCIAVCGGTLALVGLRQRSPGGVLLAAIGGTLATRALMGHRDLQLLRDSVERLGSLRQPEDHVDTAADESFPASDPPSWTSTAGLK
jgi:hypothetical protein